MSKRFNTLSSSFILCSLAGIVAFLPMHATLAQDDAASNNNDDVVRALIEELRETQNQVKDLTTEVEELRAQTDDNWLTENRAKEIRSIVSDVLSDADQRASLLQGGMTAGWDDGFFLSSQDGRFALNIDGQMQIRWVYNWHEEAGTDNHIQGFENTRSKLTFRGHIFNRDLTYLLRMDVTRNEVGLVTGLFFLQDAWVRKQLNDNWSIRFGQFKEPFNREELVSSAYQLAVERSLVNENLNLGRTQGIELQYKSDNWKINIATGDGATDNLGGFDAIIEPGGAPVYSNALLRDVEYSITGRAEWKLAGTWEQFADLTSPRDDAFGLLLGAGLHYEHGETGTPGPDDSEKWFAATFDVSLEFGGANLFASVIYHNVDTDLIGGTTVEAYGAVIQGGYYFTNEIEAFARLEWGQFNFDAGGFASPTLTVVTIGMNYYFHNHAAKLTTDFGFTFDPIAGAGTAGAPWDSDIAGYRSESRDADTQLVFRLQYQLLF